LIPIFRGKKVGGQGLRHRKKSLTAKVHHLNQFVSYKRKKMRKHKGNTRCITQRFEGEKDMTVHRLKPTGEKRERNATV